MNTLTLGTPLQYVATRLVRDPTFASRPVLKNAEEVARFLEERLDLDLDREIFGVISLSPAMQVNSAEITSIGIIDSTMTHPREIFRAAIASAAAAVILFHTHPTTGKTGPSKNDYFTTSRLISAGNAIGIKVLDHIILSDKDNWTSMQMLAGTQDLDSYCKEQTEFYGAEPMGELIDAPKRI